MIPTILELRLAFIWTYTFDTLLTGEHLTALYAFLGQADQFQQKFDEIRSQAQTYDVQIQHLTQGNSIDESAKARENERQKQQYLAQANAPGNLTLPWPWLGRRYLHHFWQYYLENQRPERLSGTEAWKFLVPLRTHIGVHIDSPWVSDWPKVRFWADGFFYPHGIALVIMPQLLFKAPGGQGPKRVMERALELYKEKLLPVTLPNGVKSQVGLNALAAQLLDHLHQQALGTDHPMTHAPNEPLTVATVIRGQGGNPFLEPATGGEIHRVLEGLCGWRDPWQTTDELTALATANLLLSRHRSPGDFVHHLKRARTVWMPTQFLENGNSSKHKYKLGCYHRNLTLLMLQTEMLAQVVTRFMALPRQQQRDKHSAYYELAHNAASRLGILYANLKEAKDPTNKQTYNSASPRVYLEENGYIDLINAARRHFNLPGDLAYQPW